MQRRKKSLKLPLFETHVHAWYLSWKKKVLVTRSVTKITISRTKNTSLGVTYHEMYIITVNRKVIRKLSKLGMKLVLWERSHSSELHQNVKLHIVILSQRQPLCWAW